MTDNKLIILHSEINNLCFPLNVIDIIKSGGEWRAEYVTLTRKGNVYRRNQMKKTAWKI